MKKIGVGKNFILSVGLMTLLMMGGVINNSNAKGTLSRGYNEPYAIVFGKNTNKIGSESYVNYSHNGEGVAKTNLGNPITFKYGLMYNPTDKWQRFAEGGYLTNTQPINGINNLNLTRSNVSHIIRVYWSSTKTFTENNSVLFDSSSPVTISTDFNGDLPNYIKILAVTDVSIVDGRIDYSCFDNYRKVTIEYYDQTRGVVNGEGNYLIGSTVTISAESVTAAWFFVWRDNNSKIISDNPVYSFTMPDYDFVIYSQFKVVKKGDVVKFGSYPQRSVTDVNLKTTLNSLTGELPDELNNGSWTSFNFYSFSSVSNYMWYQDITITGQKYRGIYSIRYRPSSTLSMGSAQNSTQDEYGYELYTVYWYIFEPVKWKVLSLNESSGPLLVAESVLDAQDVYHTLNTRTINGQTIYPNNYGYSNIRNWLNDTFFNVAFTTKEKTSIRTTTVDNSANSTGDTPNVYATQNTKDKIFLLSYRETTNEEYGFGTSQFNDIARNRYPTSYARGMGLYGVGATTNGVADWILRSPTYESASLVRYVDYNGFIRYNAFTYGTNRGILPALRLTR